jgi:hypothetical protein
MALVLQLTEAPYAKGMSNSSVCYCVRMLFLPVGVGRLVAELISSFVRRLGFALCCDRPHTARNGSKIPLASIHILFGSPPGGVEWRVRSVRRPLPINDNY